MTDNLWMLFAAAGVMVAVIGGLALLGDHCTLNNIKSRIVGGGQHGTARRALTDLERRGFLERTHRRRPNGSPTGSLYRVK